MYFIRTMTTCDLADAADIDRAVWGTDRWDYHDLAAALADPSSLCLVATRGRPLVVGFIVAERWPSSLTIERLSVSPAHQGRGLDRRLVLAVLHLLTAEVPTAEVIIWERDTPALKFWLSLGFEGAGLARGRYGRDGDGYVLAWTLPVAVEMGEAGA